MARKRTHVRQAVALRYREGKDKAPRIAAKGDGFVADKIVELARASNIPLRQDRDLVQILSALNLEEEIPENVYKAVSEILAWVYRLSNRTPVSPA